MEEVCLDDVQIVIKKHLASLIQEFDLIIPKKATELEWVGNSFSFDVDTLLKSCQTVYGFQEEFVDIQCDSSLRNSFEKGNLGRFWQKSRMKRVLLVRTQQKLYCHLLLPACVAVGFLCLHRSKQI